MTHDTIRTMKAVGRRISRLPEDAVRSAPTRKMRRVQTRNLARGAGK